MPATSGYQAGPDTTAFQFSYGAEAVWGTKPAIQFQGIRLNSESLSGTKNRGRPNEIRNDRQAAAAVTMAEEAGGGLAFGLSYATYDGFLSGLLGTDWGAALAISDATIVATSPATITATTANLFSLIEVGQFIKLAGFTTPSNNTIAQVVAKASNLSITVALPSGSLTTEAAGSRQITTGGFLKNGTQVSTFFLQKMFSASQFLQYPGAFIGGATLEAALGSFLSGNFNIMAQQEQKATTNGSTGAVLAAPNGRVHDPVSAGIAMFFSTAAQAKCRKWSLSMQNEGASMQYVLGSAAAQGLNPGVFTVSGSCELYFSDFTLYDAFKAETNTTMGFSTRSSAGSYGFSLPNANIMNPKIMAGGPGQPVLAMFDIEGNVNETTGHTFRIDRMP